MPSLHDRILGFVASECGVNADRLSPATTLLGDLGIDGDDGWELLERFSQEFGVDLGSCDPSRYFGPEGWSLWTPLAWLAIALRRGTPEERGGLTAISIADLTRSAESGFWTR